MKPYAKHLPDPFFSKGIKAVENLSGIAIARVKARLENPPDVDRQDLLARLVEGIALPFRRFEPAFRPKIIRIRAPDFTRMVDGVAWDGKHGSRREVAAQDRDTRANNHARQSE